jgi:hypothetical protein
VVLLLQQLKVLRTQSRLGKMLVDPTLVAEALPRGGQDIKGCDRGCLCLLSGFGSW